LTIRERKQDGSSVFEGVAQLDGSTPFKLTKSRSTETQFTTRSSLTQSATNFAKRYGLELDVAAPATKTATKAKATAKTGKAKSKTGGSRKSQPNSIARDSMIV
jgi:hypothetical protein